MSHFKFLKCQKLKITPLCVELHGLNQQKKPRATTGLRRKETRNRRDIHDVSANVMWQQKIHNPKNDKKFYDGLYLLLIVQ